MFDSGGFLILFQRPLEIEKFNCVVCEMLLRFVCQWIVSALLWVGCLVSCVTVIRCVVTCDLSIGCNKSRVLGGT